MHSILDTFLGNMTTIIAFMFIALKLKELIITRIQISSYLLLLTPVLVSLLSMLIMHHPLEYNGMRIDLRGVPLFFISYVMGWKYGFFSLPLPAWYRYHLGGPTVLEGLFLGILIPYLFGALFHKAKRFNPPQTIVHIRHMLIGFLCYQAAFSILLLLTTPIDFYLIIIMFLFQTLALLSIGLMQNDANRNYLYRNELEYYSRRDSITNLYNLRHFKNKVGQLIDNKQKKPFYIAMLDVDFFKQYNDTHGHPAGDKVLSTVGELLTENLRSEDLFARYGGEEFIICLPNLTKLQTAYEIVDQFREAVEKYNFKGEETQPTGKITVSIGLSGESKGKTLDALINEADQALYIAKKDGRNNTAFFK